jgi:hypothetical protein
MKVLPYWIGLFIADYILFLIPTGLFALYVSVTGFKIFSDNLNLFVYSMLEFGISLIGFTYWLSSMFKD